LERIENKQPYYTTLKQIVLFGVINIHCVMCIVFSVGVFVTEEHVLNTKHREHIHNIHNSL